MERKEGLSEFIKFAYSKGKVKNVEEAFKEYLPEDEWHKGKVENILKEKKEEYVLYEIGDIVFVKNYIYDDGKKGNNHLFVIVDKNNMAVPIENFGMLISSQLNKLRYNTNKLLEKDRKNGLHRDSIVKTDVIYIIASEQILFKIGKVDKSKIDEYKESFYNNINNENC